MKHKHPSSLSAAALLLCILSGPAALAGESPQEPDHGRPMPGSDRDAHGCIPSAGYL